MEASTDVAGAGGAITPVHLPDFVFRRVIDAPVALVFKAWTCSSCIAAWWGPHGSSNTFTAIEPHPGGRFHVHVQTPDGTVEQMGGHFVEVDEPVRIVFVTSLPDSAGNVTSETMHTVTLATAGSRTEMHLHARIIQASPVTLPRAAGMEEGWRQSLERLTAILEAI